ncbi:MAG: hypothetical protein D6743_06520 [Calditrichaeota bacterium]|nr:MAG: hypothetical protein D6743_06520 [Calditrichota bacterium]
MAYFHDSYDCTIDDNKRLSIPSRYRKVMSLLKEKIFVISTLESPCLTFYPNCKFEEKIVKAIDDMPELDDEANDLRRQIGLQTTLVPMDNQGRLVIPPRFREFAGIERKVKLVGLMNKFEVWNPERYEQYLKTKDVKAIKTAMKRRGI